MKKFLICLANFLFPGFGYIFIPRKAILGWLLLSGQIIVLCVYMSARKYNIHNVLSDLRQGGYWNLYWTFWFGALLGRIGFAYDAHQELK
jgi:hypothetical protein